MKRTFIIMFFYLLSAASNVYSADTEPEPKFTLECPDGKKFTCNAADLAQLSSYWQSLVQWAPDKGKIKFAKTDFSSALIRMVIESAQKKFSPSTTFNMFKKNAVLADEIIYYLEFSGDKKLLKNLIITSQNQKDIPIEFENVLIKEIKKNNLKIIKTMCTSFKASARYKEELNYINTFASIHQIPTDMEFASKISSRGLLYILTSEIHAVDDEASLITLLVKWITGNDANGNENNEIEDKRRKFFSAYAGQINFEKMSLHYLLNLAPLVANALKLEIEEKQSLQSRIIAAVNRQVFPKTNFAEMFAGDESSIKRKYEPLDALYFKCHFPDVSFFQEGKKYYARPVLWKGIEVWNFVQIQNAEEKFIAFFRCRNPELGHDYKLNLSAKMTLKILEKNDAEQDTTCQNLLCNFFSADNANGCVLQKIDGTFVKASPQGALTFTVLINFDKPSLPQ